MLSAGAGVRFPTTVSDLGVLVDSQLSMVEPRRRTVPGVSVPAIHQLSLMRSSLTTESAKTLVHAFVISRIDYCNSLLYGVSDELLQKLQVIQNAAARVVTAAKFDGITAVLREPTDQV